jgi:P pilus assembly chaperone PapD
MSESRALTIHFRSRDPLFVPPENKAPVPQEIALISLTKMPAAAKFLVEPKTPQSLLSVLLLLLRIN